LKIYFIKLDFLVFEETFQIFDKDFDGFITLAEIRSVMNSFGVFPCDDNIRKCIQNIDSDSMKSFLLYYLIYSYKII